MDDLVADEVRGLLVTPSRRRNRAEVDGISPDDGARLAVLPRPAERVDPARNDRDLLLERDHHRPGQESPG